MQVVIYRVIVLENGILRAAPARCHRSWRISGACHCAAGFGLRGHVAHFLNLFRLCVRTSVKIVMDTPNPSRRSIDETHPGDGTARNAFDRRALSQALSRIGEASVAEALDSLADGGASVGTRIGVTGSPGAGKSALIARLARRRLDAARRVGVLAVDPTSPISRGSILGDRLRMGGTSLDERLFFRSMPSRQAHDGLTDNIADLLWTMEQNGLDEVIVETVGVGQVNYTIRALADTVVLVLVPGAGDEIQAMKAGIMEIADIFVVNKSDLPGAQRVHSDLSATVAMRAHVPGEWQPPVLLASAENDDLGGLSEAIDEHNAWLSRAIDFRQRTRARLRYHVASLLTRRVEEVLDQLDQASLEGNVCDVYRSVLQRL